MKPLVLLAILAIAFPVCGLDAALTGPDAHEKYIYPTVRVSAKMGTGSGTLVYSMLSEKPDCYSTYVLTNHHVIASAISIDDVWDSNLQKKIKREKRGIVYVEIFKYKDLSTPVGTTKLEADIVIYSEEHDIAVLKLRYEGTVDHVATLPIKENVQNYRVADESVAVGCSLGWPPLISVGVISRVKATGFAVSKWSQHPAQDWTFDCSLQDEASLSHLVNRNLCIRD